MLDLKTVILQSPTSTKSFDTDQLHLWLLG